jgi:hypothetical protein
VCDQPQKHAIEVPHFAGDFVTERGSDWKLTLEPTVSRRPGATSAGDSLAFCVVNGSHEATFALPVDSHELRVLIFQLPHIVRMMREERLFLQCQDMGLQPVRNEDLQKLCADAWHATNGQADGENAEEPSEDDGFRHGPALSEIHRIPAVGNECPHGADDQICDDTCACTPCHGGTKIIE